MEYKSNPIENEYRFDNREKYIGQLEKSTYGQGELLPLLNHLRNDAAEWHEEAFWSEDDKEDLEVHLGLLSLLASEVEEGIVGKSSSTEVGDNIIESQLPTDEEMGAFLAVPETYGYQSFEDEELEAFRNGLIDNES